VILLAILAEGMRRLVDGFKIGRDTSFAEAGPAQRPHWSIGGWTGYAPLSALGK